MECLKEAVKRLEKGDIDIREASKHCKVPNRTLYTRWKSDDLAQKTLKPTSLPLCLLNLFATDLKRANKIIFLHVLSDADVT